MLNKFLAKIAVWLLRTQRFTGEQKMRIMNALLDNVGALPYRKIVSFNESNIQVGGKALTREQMIAFRESALSLKENYARRLFSEQRKYMAVEMGVHNGLSSEMIMFSKACLWDLQEEEKLIEAVIFDSSF